MSVVDAEKSLKKAIRDYTDNCGSVDSHGFAMTAHGPVVLAELERVRDRLQEVCESCAFGVEVRVDPVFGISFHEGDGLRVICSVESGAQAALRQSSMHINRLEIQCKHLEAELVLARIKASESPSGRYEGAIEMVEAVAKERDEAEAKLHDIQKGSEWQLMETAPKDGTRIIAWWKGDPCVTWWADYHWHGFDHQWGVTEPARWMPLPEPHPAMEES